MTSVVARRIRNAGLRYRPGSVEAATSCSILREHTPRVRGKAIRGAEARADIHTGRMLRSKKWSWLKAWAMQIARRRGMKKAIVALARRLAVIMHRIWVDGTEFRWTREQATAAA
jgi:hypothetical protein